MEHPMSSQQWEGGLLWLSFGLIGAAGALLAYLLVASSRRTVTPSTAEVTPPVSPQPLGTSAKGLQQRRPAASKQRSVTLEGSVSFGASSATSALTLGSRLDSSHTASSSYTTRPASRRMSGDTTQLTASPSALNSASPRHPSSQGREQEQDDDADDELDLVPASDEACLPLQPAADAGHSPTVGRLFVPAWWGVPQPSPLRAVSAPLAGLAGGSGSSSSAIIEAVLPSVQSLTDPSGSVTSPVSSTPQGQASAAAGAAIGRHAEAPAAAGGIAGNRPVNPAVQEGAHAGGADRATPPPPAAVAAPPHPRLDLASLAVSGAPQRAGGPHGPAAAAAASTPPAPVNPGGATSPDAPRPPQAAAVAAPANSSAGAAAACSTAGATSTSSSAAPAVLVPLVQPLGVCLPSPWTPAAGGAAGTTSSEGLQSLYGVAAAAAAAAHARPTSALYRSPLQHVTLSVKVPARFSPATASNLQSMVASHVWAGQTCLTGPDGQPRNPKDTVLHMVTVPGCIQLFLHVSQWQAPQADARASRLGTPHSACGQAASATASSTSGAAAVPAGATAAVGGGLLGPGQGAGQDAGAIMSSLGAPGTDAWWQGGVRVEGPVPGIAAAGAVLESTPAPPWLVEAVCTAVESFMRARPAQAADNTAAAAAAAAAAGGSSAGIAAQPQADSQQVQHYDGPVLLAVNGTVHTLKPNAADAQAAWVLQECSAQELAQLQAGQPFTSSAAQHGSPAATPVPLTPAAVEAPRTLHAVSQQQQSSPAPLMDSTAHSVRSGPVSQQAAARTFISSPACRVATMQGQGIGAGAGQPYASLDEAANTGSDAAAAPAPTPAAPGRGPNSSGFDPAAWVRLDTSSRASLALPPGMWAWPLYLPTTGGLDALQAGAGAEARVAVCGSSAALPVVAIHGLQSSSCRVVLASGDGSVLMDRRLPVEDGVVRFTAPASAEVRCCKIFYLLPPPSAASAPGSAPAWGGPMPPSAPPAAPAMTDQLLCMLPLLYLPPAATIELCEAARALMLARSRLTFNQKLMQQEQQRLQEPSSTLSTGEPSCTDNASVSDASASSLGGLLGSLSMDRAAATGSADGAGRGPMAAASAAAAAKAPLAAGEPDTAASAAGMTHIATSPGSRSQQLHAELGTSQHEGSFDTHMATSSGRQHLSSPSARAAAAVEPPVAAAAAAARALAGSLGAQQGGLPPPYQQRLQHVGVSSSSHQRRHSTDRRGSTDSARNHSSGSGNSSTYDSRTGLEDEPGQLNLRGRLFEGSTDVHELLNSQYLSMLADLGLLIELAGPLAAAAGGDQAAGAPAHVAGQHAAMAAEVGRQLLLWLSDMDCWHCCQLLLELLVQLGVDLCFEGRPLAPDSIASAAAVKQLLSSQGPREVAATAADVGVTAGEDSVKEVQGPGILQAAPVGPAVGRAGIWGHLPLDFPTVPVHALSPQRRLPPAPMAGTGPSSIRPLLRTPSQHAHTSSTASSSSGSSSYHSCSSEAPAAPGVTGLSAAPQSQAGGAGACPVSADTHKPSPFSMHPGGAPGTAHTAGSLGPTGLERMVLSQPQESLVPALPQLQGEMGVGGDHELLPEVGQHRRLGILDSASDMWTRLRRRSFRKLRHERDPQQG